MDISFTKELLYCLNGIKFEEVDNREDLLIEDFILKSHHLLEYMYPSNKELLRFFKFEENCIYEFKWILNSVYVLFYHKKTDKYYTIGPVLLQPYSEYRTTKTLEQLNIPKNLVKELVFFASRLPVIDESTLNRLSFLLHKSITKTTNNVSKISINIFKDRKLNLDYNFEQTTPSIRDVEKRYELSTAITEGVKQGNFSMVMSLLNKNYKQADISVRNSSPLRNMQNYCIILNTQLRHALEGIVHPYNLDQISHDIGVKIEKVKSVKEIENLMIDIIRRYCTLAKNTIYPNLKPLVHLAVAYIKEHLNEEITVQKTASYLAVNPNYLSTLFHKEMGLSFIDFVNKERITQATKLLKYTNMQVQQIALLVGYNNPTYFIKTFHKIHNKSPKQYRLDLLNSSKS